MAHRTLVESSFLSDAACDVHAFNLPFANVRSKIESKERVVSYDPPGFLRVLVVVFEDAGTGISINTGVPKINTENKDLLSSSS